MILNKNKIGAQLHYIIKKSGKVSLNYNPWFRRIQHGCPFFMAIAKSHVFSNRNSKNDFHKNKIGGAQWHFVLTSG